MELITETEVLVDPVVVVLDGQIQQLEPTLMALAVQALLVRATLVEQAVVLYQVVVVVLVLLLVLELVQTEWLRL
jgi:hypothetical protein